MTPGEAGTLPVGLRSGGHTCAQPPVHVVMLLESVVRWYRVKPLLLSSTRPIPAIVALPTLKGFPAGRGAGETLGDWLGEAEGEVLGGGAAAGLFVAAFPHAHRMLAATPIESPQTRAGFRRGMILIVS